MALNRKAFFDAVRPSLFGGRLTESQVQGMDAMLDAAPDDMPKEHLACCLAMTYHETGAKMQPVVENLNYTTASRIVAVWPTRFPTAAAAQPYVGNPQKLANKVYGGRMGNIGSNDGWLYRGRGFSQLTGRDNYARASKALGIDFVSNPDLAAVPKYAAAILYRGMTSGWFTGKKLADYFGAGKEDPFNARDIINPDKNRFENGERIGNKIARAYTKFLAALTAAEVEEPELVAEIEPDPPPKPEPEPAIPAPVPAPQPASSGGFFYAMAKSLLEALFGRKA